MSASRSVPEGGDRSSLARRIRISLVVLSAWLAFGALQISIGAALERPSATAWQRELLVDLTMALYWSAMTAPIALWHRRVRATGRGVLGMGVLHLPLLILVTLGDTLSTRLSLWLIGITPAVPFIATVTFFADFDVVSYLAVVVVADALLAREAMRAGDRRAARLEHLLSRARLEYLEAQLQPHFLFNALGAVSELAYEAPATALRVLRQLALIFRNALTARAGEVTLGEELVVIEPYLDIQRLRFPDWLRIDYDIAGDTLDCLVPRFVLQPLVENAIRHGLTGRVAAGCIEISARIESGELRLRVADNGVGLRQTPGRSGYGIGLTNVRERLATLYGVGDQLRLFGAPGGGAVAEVTLPARRIVDAKSVDSAVVPDEHVDAVHNEASHPVGAPSPMRRVAMPVGVGLIGGLLWTVQSYAYLRIRNRLGTYTLWSLTVHDVTAALLWACLAQAVFGACRYFPLARPRLALRAAAYVAGGAGFAVVHAAILLRIFTPKSALWTAANSNTFILNLLIMALLIAIGHRRQLSAWLRERERATAALSAELRNARMRATRMQSIPPVVLEALDRVIAAVRAAPSPRRTEQLLAKLADYLRIAIECSDEQGLTGARERALAQSLATLERLATTTVNSSPPPLTTP
jgi:two-component system LytT family sensor kinase